MDYEQTRWVLQQTRADEHRRLGRGAWFVGVSLVAMLAAQTAFPFLMDGLLRRAEETIALSPAHRLTYYAVYIVYYGLLLLIPVAFTALLFKQKPALPTEMRHRVSFVEGCLWVLFGVAFCVLANYITNIWLVFMSQFGVQPYEGGYNNDSGWLPFVCHLLTYAVVPALVEETVFRGWFISALQPLGERGALVLSALIFGCMHGNLTQLPFAFLLGLLFGFLYLRTGRLWLCMVIHFLNNAMSVALTACSAALSEAVYIAVQLAVFAVVALVGVAAGVLLKTHPAFSQTTAPLIDRRSVLPAGERHRMLWLNPAILISLVALMVLTVLGEVVR